MFRGYSRAFSAVFQCFLVVFWCFFGIFCDFLCFLVIFCDFLVFFCCFRGGFLLSGVEAFSGTFGLRKQEKNQEKSTKNLEKITVLL